MRKRPARPGNGPPAPASNPNWRIVKHPVVIVGAGPAGLTAAYELSKNQVTSVILEKTAATGGLSQTVEHNGYLFDIGGHRFFTKVPLIQRMWEEVLGDDFLRRKRLSRIFYKSHFFRYPLDPWNALQGLGLAESFRCGMSYAKSALFPAKPEESFETWVSNRFGRRLFEIFFRTYTEKVWGMPCSEISADWAAQRIRGLSLRTALWNAVRYRKANTNGAGIKTLIHEFHYPRLGPGMMWQRFRDEVESRGSRVIFNAPAQKIHWEPGRVTSVEAAGSIYEGGNFISSMPVRDLIQCLHPAPPQELVEAASLFRYRDFLTVALIYRGRDLFPDNWIYVHEPGVKVGRIQNYKNWSPEMTPNPETTCLGLEYFCFENDRLWSATDEELIALGRREMESLGLASTAAFLDGAVVRMPKAYPVYDRGYQGALEIVKRFLRQTPNLQLVGRNGMHQYNNQDHSMLTALLAARNILGEQHDLWSVNVDADYHEEGGELDVAGLRSTQPAVPIPRVRLPNGDRNGELAS